jgi:hypothetical protein
MAEMAQGQETKIEVEDSCKEIDNIVVRVMGQPVARIAAIQKRIRGVGDEPIPPACGVNPGPSRGTPSEGSPVPGLMMIA